MPGTERLQKQFDRCQNSYEYIDALSHCLESLGYPSDIQNLMNQVKINILYNTHMTHEEKNEVEKKLVDTLIASESQKQEPCILILSYISQIKTQL